MWAKFRFLKQKAGAVITALEGQYDVICFTIVTVTCIPSGVIYMFYARPLQTADCSRCTLM
jgi:hypothetical protein